MKRMIYISPDGNETEISENDIKALHTKMIKDFHAYWKQGNSAADLELFNDNVLTARLSVGFYEKLGLCLTYETFYDEVIRGRTIRQSDVSLAVYDKEALGEVVDVYFELYASKGLFFPPELAWKGIYHFIKTGEKTAELEWITPDELPESGNWC